MTDEERAREIVAAIQAEVASPKVPIEDTWRRHIAAALAAERERYQPVIDAAMSVCEVAQGPRIDKLAAAIRALGGEG